MDKQIKICLEKRNLLLRGFILCWEKSQISKFFCSKSRLRNIWLLEPSCGGQKCFPNQSYTLLSHRDTCLDSENFYTVKAVQFQFDSVSEVSLKSESPFWEYEVTFKQHGVCAYKCGRPEIYAFFKSEIIHSGKLNSICIKKWQNFIFNRQD